LSQSILDDNEEEEVKDYLGAKCLDYLGNDEEEYIEFFYPLEE
jgi:hypothetical protein